MKRAALFLAALAFAATAADAAPQHRAAQPAARGVARPAARPAARDWSRNVVATPEGGFRMGNPAAAVKLVEYGSLTCPHCAAFAADGEPKLVASYVRSGKVSYEFRNYVLNGIDIAASLLTRCAGPRFFDMAQSLYATQPQWIGRIAALTEAQKNEIKALSEGQRLFRIGQIGGLTQVASRYGVTPAQARVCATSKPGLDRLGKMYEAAQRLGVHGTPTFFVNGTLVNGISWVEVEPALRQAGG